MRSGIAVLLMGTVLLATSAYAVGVTNTQRPLKTPTQQATESDQGKTVETLAQRLEASVPRATSLAAPL